VSRQQPAPAGALVGGVDHHLGRVLPGNQVGRAEQVEKVLLVHPLAPVDDLVS
jgi:hypothetical protein